MNPDAPIFAPNILPVTKETEFVPGALYIMISIPLPYYLGTTTYEYPAEPASDVTFANYDPDAAAGLCREEFHWDLYFHRGASSGRLFRLRQTQNSPRVYVPDALDIANPRVLREVVGFMRIVTVEQLAIGIAERYIEKIATTSADLSPRTFAWAIMCAYRVRKNFGGGCEHDFMFQEFTLVRFTEELLRFAYSHVQDVMGPDATRDKAIMHSRFGVELDHELVEGMLLAQKERFKHRPAYTREWYP